MNMQISAANSRAAFESRASKFLVTNRTLSYWAQVSGTRKIWYQNAWNTSKVTGTSCWYQKCGRRTWVVCHGPYCCLLPNIRNHTSSFATRSWRKQKSRHKLVVFVDLTFIVRQLCFSVFLELCVGLTWTIG